jgi:SagB-type dehydrogenase family enzyme
MNTLGKIKANRDFLKCNWWDKFDDISTHQSLGKPRPDVQKPVSPEDTLIDLKALEDLPLGDVSLRHLIEKRRSHRYFSDAPLSQDELSFLLWAIQGVTQIITEDEVSYYRRTVPSGGNRHPFETYLSIQNIPGLEVGLYRYLPLDHKLVQIALDDSIPARLREASLNQNSTVHGEKFYYVERAAVTFVWTAIPYRTEWRYGPAAAKLVAVDAGHVCQNLYFAAGAIQAGTVAIGAFNQPDVDKVLGVDGEEEFSIYMAPVGKLP